MSNSNNTIYERLVWENKKIPFELKVAKKEVVQNVRTAPATIEELLENYDI